MEVDLTNDQESKLLAAIMTELKDHPPTIGVVGSSGVGKSSTINSLFNTNLTVSDTVACTKEFRNIDLKVSIKDGLAKGSSSFLRIIDAPGLGEDIRKDPDYLIMYEENLLKCDVILWVLTARNRAIALDQLYLERLSKFSDKIVFGINQIDLIEPLNWEEKINLPSKEQEKKIASIIDDRKEKISTFLNKEIVIIPYSANKKYNLQELFSFLLQYCPENRAWIFNAIKGFKPEDFLPEDVRADILNILEKRENKKKSKWSFLKFI